MPVFLRRKLEWMVEFWITIHDINMNFAPEYNWELSSDVSRLPEKSA